MKFGPGQIQHVEVGRGGKFEFDLNDPNVVIIPDGGALGFRRKKRGPADDPDSWMNVFDHRPRLKYGVIWPNVAEIVFRRSGGRRSKGIIIPSGQQREVDFDGLTVEVEHEGSKKKKQ